MFHDIPKSVLARMRELEQLDSRDRADGTPRLKRLRQIPLEVGKFSGYDRCYEAVVPRLVPGGVLVADNAINHQATLRPMLDRALQDERVDALIVPIGKGELVCRKKS